MSNQSDNKRIAKNTFVLFFRMCVIAVLGLISSQYMLKYLGEIDFGIYNVVGGAVNLMAFFNIMLASATNRFLMVELGKGTQGNLGKIFTTSLQIHAAIGVLVILLGETIGLWYVGSWLNAPIDRMSDTMIIYQISLLTCALCVLQVPYQALLMTYENFSRFSVAQMAMMVGIFAASLAIGLFESHRLIWLAIFMALSQVLGLVLYYVLGKKYAPPIQKGFDRRGFRAMVSFSGWTAFGAASSMGKNQGSNIMLNYYFGPIVNSAFSIGNQVNAQMSRLVENVSKSFTPQIMIAYEQKNGTRLTNLICSSSKYSFFMLYLAAFPIFIKTDYILTLWLGSFPEGTEIFCRIIMLDILLRALTQGLTPAVNASGMIKWFQIIGSGLTLCSIPAAMLLFHWGAPPYLLSVAFLGSSILSLSANFYMMRRILGFSMMPFLKGIFLKVLPVLVFSLPFLWLFGEWFADSIWHLLMLVAASSILLAILVYIFGLTRVERKAIARTVKRHTCNL